MFVGRSSSSTCSSEQVSCRLMSTCQMPLWAVHIVWPWQQQPLKYLRSLSTVQACCVQALYSVRDVKHADL